MNPTKTLTYSNLCRTAFGYAGSQVLYAAVRLGVPDALADGPVPVDELARRLGCDPDGLTRLLRALVVLGAVEEASPGRVALAPEAGPLCADHPRSIQAGVLLFGAPATWRAWGALADGVRTGEPAFDHVHGRPLFDHLARDPALSAVFNAAMGQGTEWVAAEVPKAYDLGSARTVVDVGGGSGVLLAAVLAAVPEARGILYDTTAGAAGAAETLRRAGLSDRCAVRTGDFFTGVPGGDVILVKGILHDWDDGRCVTLLRHCRRSIAPDGRLLVLEPVLPDRMDAPDAAGAVMSDIAMLVYTGGRERTRTQFQDLFAAGGFDLADVTEPLAGTGIRILVGHPSRQTDTGLSNVEYPIPGV